MNDIRHRRRWRAVRLAALAVGVAILATACSISSAPAALPDPTDAFFVNDFADILSDADEQTIYAAGVHLYEKTEAQVVVVTVPSLGDYTLEDYGYRLANQWGIGDKDKDNGVLLLFTTDGPHTRLEIGGGLEGAIPDSKAGRILDTYLVPWYEDEEEWSARLTDVYRAILNEVYAEYGLVEEQLPLDTPMPDDTDDVRDLVMTLVPIVIFLAVFFLIRRHGGGGGPMIFFGPPGGGFSGGGFRGGGFSGGGFSGGGGGFHGGGASR